MKNLTGMSLAVALIVCFIGAMAGPALANHAYVATNDDNPSGNTTSVYFWNASTLSPIAGSPFATGGYGLGGGEFATSRLGIATGGNGKCLFVGDTFSSNGGPSDIAAFDYVSHALIKVGNYISANGYSAGYSVGLGIAISGNTLIADYPGSGVQEEWTIGSGCTLTETGNTITGYGGNGGYADGVATTNSCYFYSAYDGTVTSATLSPFAVVGSYTAAGDGIPAGIAVSKGNLFADDAQQGPLLIDAWTINSDCSLSGDVTSGPLNDSIVGSNTMNISPNGKYIYGIGTYNGNVTTAEINGLTVTDSSCADISLSGFNSEWYYPGEGALQNNNKGAGGWQFVAEGSFGATLNNSYIGVNSISSAGCLTNLDTDYTTPSIFLLSIGTHTD